MVLKYTCEFLYSIQFSNKTIHFVTLVSKLVTDIIKSISYKDDI